METTRFDNKEGRVLERLLSQESWLNGIKAKYHPVLVSLIEPLLKAEMNYVQANRGQLSLHVSGAVGGAMAVMSEYFGRGTIQSSMYIDARFGTVRCTAARHYSINGRSLDGVIFEGSTKDETIHWLVLDSLYRGFQNREDSDDSDDDEDEGDSGDSGDSDDDDDEGGFSPPPSPLSSRPSTPDSAPHSPKDGPAPPPRPSKSSAEDAQPSTNPASCLVDPPRKSMTAAVTLAFSPPPVAASAPAAAAPAVHGPPSSTPPTHDALLLIDHDDYSDDSSPSSISSLLQELVDIALLSNAIEELTIESDDDDEKDDEVPIEEGDASNESESVHSVISALLNELVEQIAAESDDVPPFEDDDDGTMSVEEEEEEDTEERQIERAARLIFGCGQGWAQGEDCVVYSRQFGEALPLWLLEETPYSTPAGSLDGDAPALPSNGAASPLPADEDLAPEAVEVARSEERQEMDYGHEDGVSLGGNSTPLLLSPTRQSTHGSPASSHSSDRKRRSESADLSSDGSTPSQRARFPEYAMEALAVRARLEDYLAGPRRLSALPITSSMVDGELRTFWRSISTTMRLRFAMVAGVAQSALDSFSEEFILDSDNEEAVKEYAEQTTGILDVLEQLEGRAARFSSVIHEEFDVFEDDEDDFVECDETHERMHRQFTKQAKAHLAAVKKWKAVTHNLPE